MRPVVLQQGCALAARPQLRRPVRRAHAVSASALDVLLGPAVDVLPPRRAEMKRALLAAVAPTQRGARASPAQAAAIDAAAAALEARSPSASPVQSLAGLWQLAYTTEADVHAFCSLPGGVSSVSQTISPDLSRVTNRIAWRLGLQLAAGAPARASPPRRLSYSFDALSLSAAGRQLADVRLERGPGGWSDTVYVDDDMRIARNSRGDLLIFQRD